MHFHYFPSSSVSTTKKYPKAEKKLDSLIDIKRRMEELMNKTYSNNLTLRSIIMNEKVMVITYLLWKNGNRWFEQFNSTQLWETLTRNTNRPHLDLLKDYLEFHLLLSKVIHKEQRYSAIAVENNKETVILIYSLSLNFSSCYLHHSISFDAPVQ